jgi:ABC-type glutathione transport system ATPase component
MDLGQLRSANGDVGQRTARDRMGSLLKVRNLIIRYKADGPEKHQAVGGVSFDVEPGEVVGLMGESGCGKSSTALALLGLLDKAKAEISGSIELRGRELLGAGESDLQELRGTKISLVFQEPEMALSPLMRAGSQIAEVIHAHRGWNWERCRAEAKAMLARVGLEPSDRFFCAYPHQLSGGQRQRVVLAQALSCEPELLVADEPTASLDARSQADFLALLRNVKAELNISILLISHSPELQASLADRLLVMKDGRIIEEGSFEKLYESPVQDYTRMMLRRGARAAKLPVTPEHVLQEQFV